jgi:hypothetical protein
MPDIVFPTSSAPGVRPQESGGRLINAFAEATPYGAPSKVIIRRSPGLLKKQESVNHVHTRGFLDAAGLLLWVLNDRVLSVDNSFVTVDLGALVGTLPVTLAKNNALVPNYVAVTENGCFNLFTGSPPTSFADADLPGSPTSVCDMDGYFVWTFSDGRVFASDLNSVNVNALSFTTEQGLIARRAIRYTGLLFIFGDKWTGVYSDTGTIPFPFTRQGVIIPRGIVGTHAIAGWETGWANELLWVGDDYIVYKLEGYTPTPVSNNDVSRAIYSAVRAGKSGFIEAYVYMYEKNAFWVVSCHDEWTWEYNLSTGEWNERVSYGRPNWKGHRSIRIYERWLTGDELTGDLFEVSGTYFLEGVDPLIWHVESGALSGFPNRTVIPRAAFNMTTGVGDFAIEGDPKVEISWSLNGGQSYGNPVIRRLGGPGETNSHPYILSSGLSRGQGVRYRLRVSDPVHVGLSGGTVDPQGRGPSG